MRRIALGNPALRLARVHGVRSLSTNLKERLMEVMGRMGGDKGLAERVLLYGL